MNIRFFELQDIRFSIQVKAVPSLPRQKKAQSVEQLTAEREVLGSIPGAEPILRVFK